jgi:hypothetical protein
MVQTYETLVEERLVEDGVQRDGGLARLAVTNDELTLACTARVRDEYDRMKTSGCHYLFTHANRHHGIDRGDARQQRAVHGLAVNDTRRVRLHGATVAQLQPVVKEG